MGLGALLLNADQTAARLRGRRAGAAAPPAPAPDVPSRPAAPPAPAGDALAADPVPEAEQQAADFVILWPALGCPELVQPATRTIEIIFLSKREQPQVDVEHARTLLRNITVIEWDEARKPYLEENPTLPGLRWALSGLLKLDTIRVRTSLPLAGYRETIKDRPEQFGELFHTIADIVPRAYLSKGFRTIASVACELNDTLPIRTGHLYTLYYGPENGLLREILQDATILQKPYDDVPLMHDGDATTIGGHNQVYRGRRGETRAREHLVRLFHPFQIMEQQKGEYLNVGHITDMHTSTLWDFFDRKIFPRYEQDKPAI
jgi:hypothetical protein